MTSILPLTQTFPLVDEQRQMTPEFKSYEDSILARIGGVTGGSYSQLSIGGGIVGWNLDKQPIAIVVLTGSVVIAPPANMVAGLLYPYRLRLLQDAVGGRTVTWAPAYKFPGGVAPVLSCPQEQARSTRFGSPATAPTWAVASLRRIYDRWLP